MPLAANREECGAWNESISLRAGVKHEPLPASASHLHSARQRCESYSNVSRPAQNQQDNGSRTELSASAAKLRLLKSLKCTTSFEKAAWQSGARLVAGVDEAARGSLLPVTSIRIEENQHVQRVCYSYMYE